MSQETSSRRRRVRWARVVAWNVVAFVFLAELVAVGLYFVWTGSLY